MRIPSGVTDQYIYFVAVDATDLKTRETGLSSFTVYRSRNGGAAAAYTTPTINETSSANMPGVYELLLDEDMTIDSGDVEQEVCLHITQASMAPVTRIFTLFRPTVTAGETLTVASGNGAANVTQFGGTNLTATGGRPEVNTTHIAGASVSTSSAQIGVNVVNAGGTAWASGSITSGVFAADSITAAKVAADVGTEIATAVWASGTRLLTGGTNIVLAKGTGITGFNDLDASGIRSAIGLASANLDTQITGINSNIDANETKIDTIDNVLDALVADIGVNGSGLTALPWNAAWDAEVQSEVEDGLAVYDAATGTDVAGISIPSAGSIADAVWDEPLSGHLTGGSTGAVLDAIAPPSASEIADAVWDETLSGHLTVGSTGEALDGAGGGGATPADIADAVLDEVVEGSTTLRQSIKMHNAVLGGKASGMNTESVTFRSIDDDANVVVATVDQYGNRTSVVRNL